MDDIPRIILCTLIREQGVQVIQNASKFQNLLIDYTKGEFKKERKCLNDSLAEGIPDTLLTKKDQLSYHQLSQQLSQKLIDNLGVTPELAKWTVDSWALALGVISVDNLHPQDFFTTITSTPSGAGVYLDGFMKGVTPLTLKNLQFGTYQVEIKYDKYETWAQSIDIRTQDDKIISAILVESPADSASICIETFPSNAQIFLNKRKIGRSPKTLLNLSSGNYEIRLVLHGYQELVKSLQIQEGDNVRIQESFILDSGQQPVLNIPQNRTHFPIGFLIGIVALVIILIFGYSILLGSTASSVAYSKLPNNGGFYQESLPKTFEYRKTSGDWTFTFTSNNAYTLSGKVIGKHEYPPTMPNGIIPLDLAIANGDLLKPEILSYFTFAMGENSLEYTYDIPASTGLTEKYIDEHIGLNRLVFLDSAIENKVKNVETGDCLIITGKLIDIKGESPQKLFSISTSTTRNDFYPTGAEIVLVESYNPVSCT